MPCFCHQTKGQVVQPKAQALQLNSGSKLKGSGQPQARHSFASIRYSGPTSVTTTGSISGRQYKFTRTGAVVQVDSRDKAGLAKIPHLRQI
jgi:hypothetical protein